MIREIEGVVGVAPGGNNGNVQGVIVDSLKLRLLLGGKLGDYRVRLWRNDEVVQPIGVPDARARAAARHGNAHAADGGGRVVEYGSIAVARFLKVIMPMRHRVLHGVILPPRADVDDGG